MWVLIYEFMDLSYVNNTHVGSHLRGLVCHLLWWVAFRALKPLVRHGRGGMFMSSNESSFIIKEFENF